MNHCHGCCFALVLIPLLCCVLVVGTLIYVYSTAPEPPISSHFKASSTDSQAFDNMLSSVTSQAQRYPGSFTLSFNQQQLSSWMTLQGEDFAKKHGHSFPFKNVQVKLDDGVMTFYAELTGSGLKLPLEVILKPGVDGKGHFQVTAEKAHLGGLSVPKFILNGLTAQFEDVLTQPFTNVSGDYIITAMGVDGGSFVAQGQMRY